MDFQDPCSEPQPILLGSHSAHNLEVTRTISEILQSVSAHLEITKEARGSSSEKWEKRPPQSNQNGGKKNKEKIKEVRLRS